MRPLRKGVLIAVGYSPFKAGLFLVMVYSEQELVSKKSGLLNCSEEKLSAHCSGFAFRLVRCAFANSVIWIE